MDKHWSTDEWNGCYPSSWKGVVVPDAMSHPAKFSSKLVRRMYAHLLEMGWVQPGDTVLDPFGGVALGALEAMRNGLCWRGVELEPKFHEIGAANIALWNKKFGMMRRWNGSAILFQGDSRKLLEIVGQEFAGEVAVSSPPYNLPMSQEHNGSRGGARGTTPSENGAFVKYGSEPGQLEGMKSTDETFQAAISSPPFRHSDGGMGKSKPGTVIDEKLYQRHAAGNSSGKGYGATEGQLANMPEGDFQGVVSSPPFEDNLAAEFVDAKSRRDLARSRGITNAEHISPIDMEAIGGRDQKDARYGFADGQLGAESGDDFWLAARQIVEQVYLALEPGGHACWVVKDFVRNKQISPFADQWRQLCEAVGFVTVHEHRAMLVHKKGSSYTLDGETVNHQTESKSFFRRLAEKKGSPRIDWETIWCMEKPQ